MYRITTFDTFTTQYYQEFKPHHENDAGIDLVFTKNQTLKKGSNLVSFNVCLSHDCRVIGRSSISKTPLRCDETYIKAGNILLVKVECLESEYTVNKGDTLFQIINKELSRIYFMVIQADALLTSDILPIKVKTINDKTFYMEGTEIKTRRKLKLDKMSYKFMLGISCEPLLPVGFELHSCIHNVLLSNRVGIIDHQYRGELIAKTDVVDTITIEKDTTMFKIINHGFDKINVISSEILNTTSRGSGGFGSTNARIHRR